jgi:hypothetical protein
MGWFVKIQYKITKTSAGTQTRKNTGGSPAHLQEHRRITKPNPN